MTDLRETLARIIDPEAFTLWQNLFDFAVAHHADEGEDFARCLADHSYAARKAEALAKADDCIAALPAPVGEGPTEPTPEMVEAGGKAVRKLWMHASSVSIAEATYRAMIAASPSPVVVGDEVVERMARAHYLHRYQWGATALAPWGTEASEAPVEIQAMRAALSVLEDDR